MDTHTPKKAQAPAPKGPPPPLPGAPMAADEGFLVGRGALAQSLMLEERGPSHLIRLAGFFVCIMVCLFIAWAAITEITEVVVSSGEVSPIGSVKRVQHLEGGIVKEIFVGEGDLAIEVDIEKVIDDGIKQLLLDGLMMRGGIDVIGGRPMFTADGAENVMEGFTRPGQLAKLLENDKVFENVSEILGDDHAGFVRDIAVYMNMKADSVMGKYDPTIDKIVRGFGTNQLISRAFNIRRGMVSPQYVAAELAVAVAGQAGIDMMKLAATNEDGARFMHRFMEFPESMTKADLNAFSNLLTTFVITEFGALGLNIRDYLVGVDVSELSEEAQENIEAATAALTGEKE